MALQSPTRSSWTGFKGPAAGLQQATPLHRSVVLHPHKSSAPVSSRPLYSSTMLPQAASSTVEAAEKLTQQAYQAIRAGLETLTRPDAGQDCSSKLSPVGRKATTLSQCHTGSNAWTLSQEFVLGPGTPPIGLHAAVVQLSSGGLLVFSPVSMTGEAAALVESLPGPVEHVVLPNLSPEHYSHAPGWAARFPNATFWIVPGLAASGALGKEVVAKVGAKNNVKFLQAGSPPELGGDVQVALFDVPGLVSEATLFFPKHHAIAVADLAFADYGYTKEKASALNVWISKMVGTHGRMGSPTGFPLMMKDRKAAHAWYSVVSSWDFDKVWASHLDPVLVEGKLDFERCFSFLK